MKKLIITIFIMAIFAVSSYAGNVDTFGIGARATALGGAYTATADDPYAVYYNPAGLVHIDNKVVSFGFTLVDPELEITNFKVEKDGNLIAGPKSFEDESHDLIVPHLGYTMPINDKFTFGIATYVPFGLHIKWDKTNNLSANPAGYNSHESWYTRVVVTPAIGYKYNDKLSFGFGFSIGRSESGAAFNSYDLYKNGITAEIKGEFTDEANYSWNTGVMYKYSESMTLGLTYRSRTEADFKGDMKLKSLTDAEKATLKAIGINQYKFDGEVKNVDHPEQIQFGVRYCPTDRVSIEGDLVWTKWSIVENQTVVLEPAVTALLGTNVDKFPRSWEDTKQIKIGIEYLMTDMFTFRIGYFYDPTPVPDDTVDMVWPDGDKKTYSVGLGVNLGSWTVDGSLQYTETEMARKVGGESYNLNHSYDKHHGSKVSFEGKGTIYGFGLTATYRF